MARQSLGDLGGNYITIPYEDGQDFSCLPSRFAWRRPGWTTATKTYPKETATPVCLKPTTSNLPASKYTGNRLQKFWAGRAADFGINTVKVACSVLTGKVEAWKNY